MSLNSKKGLFFSNQMLGCACHLFFLFDFFQCLGRFCVTLLLVRHINPAVELFIIGFLHPLQERAVPTAIKLLHFFSKIQVCVHIILTIKSLLCCKSFNFMKSSIQGHDVSNLNECSIGLFV